jgi:hypothetical protein
MKKTTSQDLIKRLSQYSMLTLDIAVVADANGQVKYTDVADDSQPFDTEFLINFIGVDQPGPSEGPHEFGVKAWANGYGSRSIRR